MIIRDFGVRQGRKALATPMRQACQRMLSTESSSTTSPSTEPEQASSTPSARPSLFRATARQSRRRQAPDTTKRDYEMAQALYADTGSIGSKVTKTYLPSDVFSNPPGPKDVTLELLMASQAHMGHHTSTWNPANARYIYGVRQGIHIISLEETAAHLRRAARVVEEVAYRGGLILFVGTRPGQTQTVTMAARLAGACYLFNKWVPGTLTNSDKILRLPIKIVDELDRDMHGFEQHLMGHRALVPDLVVCLNPLENFTLLYECGLMNVPTIGVVDTNTDPTWVSYAIPANDDSNRCIAVIGSVLGRAGETGHTRRLEAAQEGIVPWKTPGNIQHFVEIQHRYARWTELAAAHRVKAVEEERKARRSL